MRKIKGIPKNRIVPILHTIIAVIFIALATTSWGFSMFDESSKIKKDMEEYMHATYGREFVVPEPRLVGGGLGRATTYVSKKAYPADDPELKFDISWDTMERTYITTYLAAKWSREGQKAMEQKLREVYGEGNFFIDKYWSVWNKTEDQKFTWQDVMKNRAQQNRIDFRYFVFIDGNLDRKKEAQRAYKILKENLIDYRVMQYNFGVMFIYNNKKEQLINILADKDKSSQLGMDELHKSGLLKDWIRVNYWGKGFSKLLGKEVESADDLLNTRFQIKGGQ